MPETLDWFSDDELQEMLDAEAAEGVQVFMCADMRELLELAQRFEATISANPSQSGR